MSRKFALAAVAATLAVAVRPIEAHAQKALVYCPVNIDASGCGRIADALAVRFPDGVDRGYDGSSGTVDLRKADLQHYAVIVVPSLADNDATKPYALLRELAPAFRMAINGRVAVYSGAPDQGATNRDAKNALIGNLASWAAGGHKYKTGLVGLVALLDLSADATSRYSWVKSLSPVEVSADAEMQSFGAVESMGDAGSLLSRGGSAIAYGNMASLGLHIGKQGAARATAGAIAGTTSRQVVLVKFSLAGDSATAGGGASFSRSVAGGASMSTLGAASTATTSAASGPTLATDKPDYLPSDTVTFTGTGFGAADTVVITLHEDPHWADPDRTVIAVADASGNFTNRTFVVDAHDFGVTFTATAVGSPSGLSAQMTFTDGNSTVTGTVRSAAGVAIAGATVTCTVALGCNSTVSTTTLSNGTYSLALNFPGNSATIALTASASGFTSADSSISVSNGPNQTKDFKLSPGSVATTTSVTSSASSGSSFGQSVTFTATVTQNTGGNPPVTAGMVTFIEGGTCAAPTTTLQAAASVTAGGIVTFATAALSPSGSPHSIIACYAGTASFGASQGAVSQTVNKATPAFANLTAPATITYGAATLSIGGTVAAGSTIPTGNVSITLNGVTQTAAITPVTGAFTTSFNTSALPASATAYVVIYAFAADANFDAASNNNSTTVTVNKALATLLLGSLNPTYDGSPKVATATTTPTGLAVSFTYDDTPTPPTNAGSYAVIGTINEINYQGSAGGTLVIGKGSQAAVTVTMPPNATYLQTGLSAVASGGSGTGGYSYDATGSTACTVNATTGALTITSGTGACAVTATRATDVNYLVSAPSAAATSTILKANQAALTLSGAPSTADYQSTFSVTPGGGSSSASLVVTTSGVCTNVGNAVTMTSGTGTCTVNVNRAGDANYNDATQVSSSVTAAKIAQAALTLTGVPTNAAYLSSFTVTPGGGSSSAAPVVGSSGVCTNVGNVVTMTSGTGTCTVTVNRAGDDNYLAATQFSASATATKIDQAALTLTGVPGTADYLSSFTVTAGGGSSSAAIVVGTSGVCTSVGSVVTMTSGTGTCTVTVNRAGDNNYNPAAQLTSSPVTATKINQAVVTLVMPANATYLEAGLSAVASGGSGTGTYSYDATGSTACTVNATTGALTITSGTGTCSVTATRAADNNYLVSAQSAAATSTILKATQATVTVSMPATVTYLQTGLSAVASGGSGTGAYSYDAGASTACTVNSGTGALSITSGTGNCSVTATRAADNNYLASAQSAPATSTVLKANQAALTLTGAPASAGYQSSFTVTPGGGSSTSLFIVGTSGVCSNIANAVTMTSGTGTCTVTVNRAGDANYHDATPTSVLVTGEKINQALLTLTGVPANAAYLSTFTVTPGGGSSTAALAVSTSGVCTVAANVVSMTSGTGTCTVLVNRAGDDNYLAAATVSASATATKIDQTALTLLGVPASANYQSSFTVTPGGGSSSAPLVVGTSGVCTNAGNLVTMTSGTGTCTVTVNRAGDNNYNPATQISSTPVTAAKINQAVVTVAMPATATYQQTGLSAVASGGSGTGADSYDATGSTACTVNATTGALTITSGTGTCAVTATRAADSNYLASAQSGAASTTILKANQATLTVTAPTAGAYADKLTPAASGGSGTGAISFGVTGGACAMGTGADAGKVVITSALGTCAVIATKATDADYLVANSAPQPVTITNDAPVITNAVGPAAPVASGSPVVVTGSFTDPGFVADLYTISSVWTTSGAAAITVSGIQNTYNGNTGTFTITAPNNIAPGVYTVKVTVTDKFSVQSQVWTVLSYVVVYDPNGGFVTGGGWINSPSDACVLTTACAGATGKANFGFVSKYQKGSNVPTGNTEFQFQAGNLNFKSISYEWLVIAGARAQYKGTGTINGGGNYGFLLTAIDGSVNGGGGIDRFRIKIWDINNGGAIVYDNQMNSTDDAGLTTSGTVLGGGSISIKAK